MHRKLIALEAIEKIIRQFEFGKKPNFNTISQILGEAFNAKLCSYFFWDSKINIKECSTFLYNEKNHYVAFNRDCRKKFKPLVEKNHRKILTSKIVEVQDFSCFSEEALQSLNEMKVSYIILFPITGISVESNGCFLFGLENNKFDLNEDLIKIGELAAEMTASYLFNINALNVSEKKFQNLVEHTNDIVYSIDKQGNITYVNSNVEKYGYKADNLTGKNVFDFIHPDDRDLMQENFTRKLQGEEDFFSEYRLMDAFGNYIWFEQSSKICKDNTGNITGVSGFARNINERKEAEDALKSSEEKYRILVERSTDGICIITGEEVIYANPRMEKMTGKKCGEIMGKPFMPLFAPEQMVIVAKKYMMHMNGEEDPQIYQTALQHTDGSIIDVEYTASLIDYGDQKASLVFIHDLSERKKTEQALIRSERLAAVGTLAGGIAHEFNNINVTILGFTQLAIERKDLDEELRDWLNRIHKAATRAGKITHNLLTFSRPEDSSETKVNINTVIDDVVNLVIREFESDGIKITLKPGKTVSIPMDENQVGQVILNMLINARHAMLGRPGKEIIIKTCSDDDFIYVKVSDTGCGISKENLKNIFSPFFTTKGEHNKENTAQSSIKGTGLGLSISESIISKHGGTINVKSEQNAGTTFTIKLPLRKENFVKKVVINQEQIRETKVVIIEKENDYRNLINMLLEKQNYDVFCTADLIDGIDIIREGETDIVIASVEILRDVEEEFFKLLSNLTQFERPEVILISSVNPEELKQLPNYSAFDIIKKPFELDFFCEMVYSAIARKRGHNLEP